MSGGSLEYAYFKIDELAGMIEDRAETPLHTAFADHLRKCAKAAHDLEWVWSCDKSQGDENNAILEVVSPTAVLHSVVVRAEKQMELLQQAIDLVKDK